MQILFVATNLPVPPNNGQAIRSLSIIQGLASSGHGLSFLSFANIGRPENLHPLATLCRSIDLLELEMKNLTERTDYLRRLKCLLALKPYSVERFRSAAMRARIREELIGGKYDLILCDGLYALANIPVSTIPIVLNCHNVEYIILKRYAQLERNPLKRYYAWIESFLMRNAERDGCHRVARAMVCSQIDLDILRRLRPDLPVFVVPNVVDTDLIQPVEREYQGSTDPVLLFQGVMDWYPNRDAVEFFARAILPRVRAECPNVKLIVAGRNPPNQFVEQFRSDPKIEFTGTVPDMRPYLAAATVVIVPLRVGGGTRIKILEACAAGKPIVSTSVGAEGLDLEPGKEIILADDPAEFARSVVSLLQHSARSGAVAKSARAAVTERYSHVTLKRSLDALISACVNDLELETQATNDDRVDLG
jgi:glycosyltransferase involved in cell wall biosynthesis